MGCFASKDHRSATPYNGYASRGGPAYVSHDDTLSEELLHHITNLGVDPHASFVGRGRAPSINLAGRGTLDTALYGSQASFAPVQRKVSVKEVPGSQLQWTASRNDLEDQLQHANSHPAPPGGSDWGRLQTRLAQLHLDMWEMAGDGNCQFRAISNGLYGSEQHHMLVREAAVRHMHRHKDEFEPYLGEDWHRYTSNMAADGTWGDELTLRAVCDVYGILISVITSDEAHWFMRYKPQGKLKEYKGSAREIFLTYIAPVHYNAIRRTSRQQPGSKLGSVAVGGVSKAPQLEALQEVSSHSGQPEPSTSSSPFAAVQRGPNP